MSTGDRLLALEREVSSLKVQVATLHKEMAAITRPDSTSVTHAKPSTQPQPTPQLLSLLPLPGEGITQKK